MRFALVDGKRIEATSRLKGACPGCLQPVIAKCGTQRIHHWAHYNSIACDRWWEPETEWHREWKNKFPADWQEIFLPDELTGEKHIADILTENGLVIEFQHSPILPEGRSAREAFYQNMVWVVDGMRLKRDYIRFLKRKKKFKWTDNPRIFHVEYPEICFPINWLESSVPVVFDFGDHELRNGFQIIKTPLYCLFPVRTANHVTLAEISRSTFIRTAMDGSWSLRVRTFLDALNQEHHEWQYRTAMLRLELAVIDRLNRQVRHKRRRLL